ncbi:MAG: hypothetical protein NVV60_05840 [Luteimonas sp.]|nr:hypothetical protein [Luteimonas sp.]
MTIHRKKMLVAAALAVVGTSGYFVYSLFAAQAQSGTLAQAPLNTQVQVPPAFIMAMDDSRSMGYQSVFPTRDTQNLAGGGAVHAGAEIPTLRRMPRGVFFRPRPTAVGSGFKPRHLCLFLLHGGSSGYGFEQ